MVAPPFHRKRLPADELLDRDALATALAARGVTSVMPDDTDDGVVRLLGVLKPGDVVIGCSSGAFGGIHTRLIEALERGDER